ncbi:hypothetical protein A3J32_00230 [Candidatus Saccharibacteria bacterium RIFCSPLOWO2_02_FULL_46_7]|nr:MAG: hypothetical protein A3J32_00230 [Candidatus Saccharibacteria bacterium RIFCSPLOWO2_02_FULL_46_7]
MPDDQAVLFSPSHGYLCLVEQRLVTEFDDLVGELALNQIVHLVENRTSLPKNLRLYGLVPFSSKKNGTCSTLETSAWSYNWLNGIIPPTELPYLDTGLAIGLTFKGRLSAVAGAGINRDEKALQIKQIQGTVVVDREECANEAERRSRYKMSGLHGGILWRDTLVEAWIEIARRLGIELVQIRGAANNGYRTEVRKDRLIKGYDIVAYRMGFQYDEETLNWFRTTSVS